MTRDMAPLDDSLTPRRIVQALDEYIVGQEDAKRNVAIALRNRWRWYHTPAEMRKEIVPNNILMIGATGIGKTEIARRLATLVQAPFVKVEASKFTEVGYVGRDVESMIRDLVEQSVNLEKRRKEKVLEKRASEVVEERILSILIPPTMVSKPAAVATGEQAAPEVLNRETRERFRKQLKMGSLDDKKVEVDVEAHPNVEIGMIGPGMEDANFSGMQEMVNRMFPKKKKKKRLSIKEARQILLEQELARMMDMDEIRREALAKAENMGIVFIDEIDKVASSGKSGGADVSREGVQRDLLPIIEGSVVNTKYGAIRTDHILFISAGAFHFAKPSDLIPELQGRFSIRVELNNLSQADFLTILKKPKNALVKQYAALLATEGVALSFTNDALGAVAYYAFEINNALENIGARRLHMVMSHLLNDYLFSIPEQLPKGRAIRITKAYVKDKLSALVTDEKFNEYML